MPKIYSNEQGFLRYQKQEQDFVLFKFDMEVDDTLVFLVTKDFYEEASRDLTILTEYHEQNEMELEPFILNYISKIVPQKCWVSYSIGR